MANTFVNATAVSREFLRVLRSNIPFCSSVDRQYNNDVAAGSVKHGGTIKIRKPAEFDVRTGAIANVQNATATSEDLAIATQFGIDISITSRQMTQNLDDLSAEIITPAAARLAAKMESYFMNLAMPTIYNNVGTIGTAPATTLVWLEAQAKLDASRALRDGNRTAIIHPAAQAATVSGLSTLFQNGAKISKQYDSGELGDALGLKFKLGQLAPVWTNGTRDSGAAVKGASQTGASLIVDGLTDTETITAGTNFTIAGVYAVNQDKQSTGVLQDFVVTAVSGAVSTDITLTISPAIVTSGATQNVSAGPLNDAVVTFKTNTASVASPQSLVFHKDFYTLATVDMELPKGLAFASRENMDGISIRVLGDYNILNDITVWRFDILAGGLAQRPELACRVNG